MCGGNEKWGDALFEDYTGPQMINRPSYPEFTVQFKTLLCPFLCWELNVAGKEKFLEQDCSRELSLSAEKDA